MSIEGTIKGILVEDLNVDHAPQDIIGTLSIRDDLGVDSLGFEELRARCEEEFKVNISEEDYGSDAFATVQALTALILRLTSTAAASGGQA
ncbi:coronafacic acid synthetase [Streptomyces spiroverticillatus]|uniref:Coronafacic acid synthetase n=1 Tax=Streptomyces finlayi TaxID=67296 RepID=A0A918X9G8_9ACTN|nr:phosphopantetheine-binding protein [Streptomyces finlayi]GHA49546.1 coronafacic acid synthetase [Streptomyces spiroverticillatus]GHD19382.1 coronafacic acid synthetase [Streptomyces finlayi]